MAGSKVIQPATREGGLSLHDAVADVPRKHAASKACTAQLTQLIVDSVRELPNAKNNTDAARAKAVYTENAERLTKEADNACKLGSLTRCGGGRWSVHE